MSSNSNKELSLYKLAGFAKEAAEMLQRRMSSSNEALAASTCLEDRKGCYDDLAFLKKCVDALEKRSRYQASKTWTELVDFLDNHATWPRQMFWSHFEKKLKAVGEASVEFRETCFHRSFEDDGCTIFHLVCKLNPPVEVVQTLIDVIPLGKGKYCSQYNHLSRTYMSDNDCTYPLHVVMKHGGSLDLVKLLVEADEEKKTLETFDSSDRKINTLLHVLISNRANHKPQTFSAILHYLIPKLDIPKSELHKVNESEDIPVVLLYDTLKKEGMTLTEIFDNTDFKFLLQATCYHENCRYDSKKQDMSEEFDDRCRDIERIAIDYAFLICSCCFVEETVIEVLEYLFSRDKSFLLNKDMHGIYPIMGMIEDGFDSKYCVDLYMARSTDPRYDDFKCFIVSEILRLAPECARQTKQGLFPLHIVADRQRLHYKSDRSRLELLHSIWKADPDVASIMDKELNLPPFALPERYVKGSYKNIEEDPDDWRSVSESRTYTGLSSTYFLLRQQPEMIAETITMMQKESKEVTEPSPKRMKKG